MKKLIHPDVNIIFPVAPTTKINKEVVSDKFIESWRVSFFQNPYKNVDDWFEFYGFENKQPNISKDEARNIIKKLSLKPFESKFKINVLWLPEYLHIFTSNALLKILEEPPGQTLFFIVSNDYQKLLKTILSRVQIFKVPRFSDNEIKMYLSKYAEVSFSIPISEYLIPLFSDLSLSSILIIERFCWWFHIIGILAFLNYLVISKHLHIILAFPNTYFSNLNSKGEISNMSSVTNEVKMMLNPDIDPFSINGENSPERFGAKDVKDLTWVQLMNAYSCTECGRCSSECPANQTGKLLSPRKIMMDVRDRIEEVGRNIDKNGSFKDDNKKLLGDYISKEELWACTSCNACVEECPISINPLSIIMDMRRHLIMEESSAPNELNNMMNNIENNGAPWPYNQQDRLNWNE